MKIISTHHYRNLTISLIIIRKGYTSHTLSINVKKGYKTYNVVTDYLCQLTEPVITIDTKNVANEFCLEVFEEAPELRDYILKLNIDNDTSSALVIYGSNSNLCSPLIFKFE